MRVYIAVALLLTLGLLARMVGLERTPPALWSDEANNGLDADEILSTGRVTVFFPGNCGQEPLFKYVIAGITRVMGPGVRAIRGAAAMSGWLLLPLAWVWFGRRRGAVSALWLLVFLSFGVWHLQFSRIGFRAIMGPTVGMAALLAVDGGRRHRSVLAAVLAGVAAGLTWYTYPAHRLLPVVSGLWLALSLRDGRRRMLSALAAYAVGVALCLIPLLGAWRNAPELFSARASMAALWSETPDVAAGLLRNAVRHLGMFTVAGDLNWRHNLSGAPHLDPVTGVFFIVGLGRALGRRDRVDTLLLAWLGIMLLPGILSVERQAPHGLRTIGVLPVPYMLAADGIVFLAGVIRGRRARAVGAFLLAFVVLLLNGHRYFVAWPARLAELCPADESLYGFNRQEYALARWLNTRGDARIWVSPQLYLHPTTAYLAEGDACRMLVHPDSLLPRDLLVLQVAPRNLWWLRDDFRKNFFLWWWRTGRVTEEDTWLALSTFYPACGGALAHAEDTLIRERVAEDFETEVIQEVAGLPVFRVASRRVPPMPDAPDDLAAWRRVPAGCLEVRIDSITGQAKDVALWAKDENRSAMWLLDTADLTMPHGPVLRGCLVWPSCIRVGQSSPDSTEGLSVYGSVHFSSAADPEPYLRHTWWGKLRRLMAQARATTER